MDKLAEMIANKSSAIDAQEFADYLRSQGVVLPPCKIGDIIYSNLRWRGSYLREKDAPYAYKVCFIGINGSESDGGGFVNVVHENGSMLQFIFSQFGKTVFLDRNAAIKTSALNS